MNEGGRGRSRLRLVRFRIVKERVESPETITPRPHHRPHGDLFSAAYGINESGQIVGVSRRYYSNELRAILYDETGAVHDLNELVVNLGDWTLREAVDINEGGQIVGYGTIGTQTLRHAFLLTPVGSPPPPLIPEPSALIIWSALATLGIGVGWCRRVGRAGQRHLVNSE